MYLERAGSSYIGVEVKICCCVILHVGQGLDLFIYLVHTNNYQSRISESAVMSGRSRAAGSVELERQVEGSEGAGSVLSYNPHIHLTLTQQRQRLPIFKVSFSKI